MKAADRAWRSLVPALGLLALLVVLAVLQFRWTGQLSRAEGARLRANLERTVSDLAREFDREITRALAYFALGGDDAVGESGDLERRWAEWAESATYPEIVADVLLVGAREEATPEIRRFDPSTRTVAPLEPAASLQPVLDRVDAWASGRERGRRGPRPSLIVESPLAIVVPRLTRGRPDGLPRGPRFVIVRLDERAIKERFLPDLVMRYFADVGDGAAYDVTVRGAYGPVYTADGVPGNEAVDVHVPILGILPYRDVRGLILEDDRATSSPDAPRRGPGHRHDGPPSVLSRGDRDGVWTLEVTHPAGSLANAVARQRARNLGISFAVLVLLGVSVAFALRSARRAQDLAQQKMEFVAGVSHELRTPLAVIRSAGQNLADGLTGDPEHTKRYGEVIRREGERLSEMVEQVLDHARVQSGRPGRDAEAVDLHVVIDGALADCSAAIGEHGIEVERDVPEELPLVQGESRALRQALRNLIANAIRHSDEPWVRIEARVAKRRGGAALRVAVEDRGPGIEPAERERLFQPFYRGRTASRIHGSGLGLSLVRQIVDAHRGSVTIEESPAGGSRFVIQLPVATPEATAAAAGGRGEPETEPSGRA